MIISMIFSNFFLRVERKIKGPTRENGHSVPKKLKAKINY